VFRRMMDVLCCPVCKGDLSLSIESLVRLERPITIPPPGCRGRCEYGHRLLQSEEDRRRAHDLCEQCYWEDVDEGSLSCPRGHTYPISGSIPRLLPPGAKRQRTKKTFDVEWTGFRYGEKIYGHSEKEEIEDFFRRTAVDEECIRHKTVLDAGCGIGRLARGIGRLAREVVAMDFSEGVDEAWRLNMENPAVHIVQGDILAPPFRQGSFDYVYSKGVLQYVSDVGKSLASLASQVGPGGALSVTLYPRMSVPFEIAGRWTRRITVRLPVRANYLLSHLLIPFLPVAWSWSGMQRRSIEWGERAHMIFNWLSSPYQNSSTNREMEACFRDLEFNEVRVSTIPVGITGKKSVVRSSGQ
jgi:SAM-dependent methyltransferase